MKCNGMKNPSSYKTIIAFNPYFTSIFRHCVTNQKFETLVRDHFAILGILLSRLRTEYPHNLPFHHNFDSR